MSIKSDLQILTRHPARLEPLLAELIKTGQLREGALLFRPGSLFKRGYNKDVSKVDVTLQERGKKTQEETVWVDVNREGFYDALPEFLFHKPETVAGYKNLEQRLKESKKVQEEEQMARLFFLPFEQEFYRQRIRIEQEELPLLSGFANPMQRMIIERLWSGIPNIDEESLSLLFYLLPLAYKITGNRSLMESCFSTVLRDAVTLADLRPGHSPINVPEEHYLGDYALGLDMTLSGMIEEELPDLQVTIGPLPLDRVTEYVGKGRKKALLDILYSYFIPAEMDVFTEFRIENLQDGFCLSDDPACALLGYTTYL